jgi:hypothetical protein
MAETRGKLLESQAQRDSYAMKLQQVAQQVAQQEDSPLDLQDLLKGSEDYTDVLKVGAAAAGRRLLGAAAGAGVAAGAGAAQRPGARCCSWSCRRCLHSTAWAPAHPCPPPPTGPPRAHRGAGAGGEAAHLAAAVLGVPHAPHHQLSAHAGGAGGRGGHGGQQQQRRAGPQRAGHAHGRGHGPGPGRRLSHRRGPRVCCAGLGAHVRGAALPRAAQGPARAGAVPAGQPAGVLRCGPAAARPPRCCCCCCCCCCSPAAGPAANPAGSSSTSCSRRWPRCTSC